MATVQEYARTKGMHPESVRRAIRQGRIKARKRGRGPKKPWLVDASQVVVGGQQVVTQRVEDSVERIPAPLPQPDLLGRLPAPVPAAGLTRRLGIRLLSMFGMISVGRCFTMTRRALGSMLGVVSTDASQSARELPTAGASFRRT